MRSEKLKLLLKMELKKLLNGSFKRKKAIKIWQYVLSVAVILIYVVMFTFFGERQSGAVVNIFFHGGDGIYPNGSY